MNPLLSDIDLFMANHGLSQTKFGQEALGDRHFVKQLRAGRDIRQSTERRVREFMLTYRQEVA